MTERTRVRRIPENAVTDLNVLFDVIDAGRVGNLAIVEDEQPLILPMAYARRGNEIIVHGSTGSRLFRALDAGARTCFSVTHVDGIVAARSAFHSSMHYRSALILGTAHRLHGDDELHALEVLTEHLIPGRWADARQPNRKERAKTMTLALPIAEWSVKIGDGPPEDEPEDYITKPWADVWAGVLPLSQRAGEPIPDQVTRERGIALPEYLSSP